MWLMSESERIFGLLGNSRMSLDLEAYADY